MSNQTARLCNELNELIDVSSPSLQLDLAVERNVDAQAGHLQSDGRRKRFVALDAACGDCVPHGVLDRALRIDADHLQIFPNAEVEGFFVHRELRSVRVEV